MTEPPLPATEPPFEALEALAAGELPAGEARALEARLRAEPGWRTAYTSVCEVEAWLRAEPLLPVPRGVLRRVLAATRPPRRERPALVLARVAAAVLAFAASWFAFAGDVSAMAALGPRAEVAAALPAALVAAPAGELWLPPAGPGGSTPEALSFLLGGLALLGTGLAVGLRRHRRALDPRNGDR